MFRVCYQLHTDQSDQSDHSDKLRLFDMELIVRFIVKGYVKCWGHDSIKCTQKHYIPTVIIFIGMHFYIQLKTILNEWGLSQHTSLNENIFN